MVVPKVNNITCGAVSSYAASTLLEKLNVQEVRKETNWTEMMMQSIVTKVSLLKLIKIEVEIEDLSGSFQFKSEVSKAERGTVLSLPNPDYEAQQ